jgi:hypothetical protein
MRRFLCLLIVVIGFSLFVTGAHAQVARGTPPFGSFGGGPDVLNLGNLNAHISIPVFARSGRGISFAYNLSYDSSIWVPSNTSGWQPVKNWGWTGTNDLASPATGKLTSPSSYPTPCNTKIDHYTSYFWTYTDKDGVPTISRMKRRNKHIPAAGRPPRSTSWHRMARAITSQSRGRALARSHGVLALFWVQLECSLTAMAIKSR